jgi:lysophospholipase
MLVILGTDERIVESSAILARAATWPGCRLHKVEGGRHEVLMEGPAMRQPVLDLITRWCDEVITVQRKTG